MARWRSVVDVVPSLAKAAFFHSRSLDGSLLRSHIFDTLGRGWPGDPARSLPGQI